MKTALKISLTFTALVYVLNNILSGLDVLGLLPDSVFTVLNPVNVNFINMAVGLLIGAWLLISYKRSTNKFPIALIAFFLLCFFKPLLGTLAIALFYQVNQSRLPSEEDDIIENLIQ